MSEIDLPVLAALAEVPPPSAGSAGARFLRAAWCSGAPAVPRDDDEVWAAWVDLRLWQRSPVRGPADLTAHARADLAVVADVLGQAAVPPTVAPAVPPTVPPLEPASGCGLTAEQDARLRTLAALTELGELSPELEQLGRSYRERDQRTVVRPPAQVTWTSGEGRTGQT